MQSLNRAHPVRRDPAPSRVAYRMQRLWLTPIFRTLFRFGLPVVVVAGIAAAVLGSADRRAAIYGSFADLRAQFEARPEFRVSLIRVEGASPELADAVRAKLGLRLPLSSLELDLDLAREKVGDLDAVASATVQVRSGGVLQVSITERVPLLVWRFEGALALLDSKGHRVAGLAERADRADLALIAGEGADGAAAEALALFEAAGPINARLRGLVRIGNRRWDLILDRDQTIMLPQYQPVAALERLLALDAVEDILARDVLAVDLRNDQRPTLRMSNRAWATLSGIPLDEAPKSESDL
jgi:cell division protein FtsQ